MASEYLVLFRAKAVAHFEYGHSLPIQDFPSPTGLPVQMKFFTHYADEGYDVQLPQEMRIEIRGSAESIEGAIKNFSIAANTVLPAIALSANAYIDQVETILAFDISPNIDRRNFAQYYVERERGKELYEGRFINVDMAKAVIQAIYSSQNNVRAFRAANQYLLALHHWKPGRDSLCLAHLYMGIEALTELAIKRECRIESVDKAGLAKKWGFDIEAGDKDKRHQNRKTFDAEIRKRILFQGDEECYRLARQASDGLEHGYLSLNEVYDNASQIKNRLFHYLRADIFELLPLTEAIKKQLLDKPYDIPLGFWNITRLLKGYLIGSKNQFAEIDYGYPWIERTSRIKSVTKTENGKDKYTFEEDYAPRLGDKMSLNVVSLETWGPPGHFDTEQTGDNSEES